MRNFFYRISSAMARFMYGRNGRDQLSDALTFLYLIVYLLSVFLGRVRGVGGALSVLALLLAVAVLFRVFSRDLARRRAENAKFLSWWQPVRGRISGARQRRQDKDHKYFTCKNCRVICRVPAGKGKIEITCPKCGQKIIGRS